MAQDAAQGKGPGVTVAQAAEALGLSPEAVRKRLRRGTLSGQKRDGEWYVSLPVEGGEAASRTIKQATRAAQAGVYTRPVQRIRELEARIRELEDERDYLRGALSGAIAATAQLALPAAREGRPWWQFWKA